MEYRYILDSSSKKFRCRKCTKKTLVKFIDTKTNDLMTDEFGRCDRESKCGFFKYPKDLIMINMSINISNRLE